MKEGNLAVGVLLRAKLIQRNLSFLSGSQEGDAISGWDVPFWAYAGHGGGPEPASWFAVVAQIVSFRHTYRIGRLFSK